MESVAVGEGTKMEWSQWMLSGLVSVWSLPKTPKHSNWCPFWLATKMNWIDFLYCWRACPCLQRRAHFKWAERHLNKQAQKMGGGSGKAASNSLSSRISACQAGLRLLSLNIPWLNEPFCSATEEPFDFSLGKRSGSFSSKPAMLLETRKLFGDSFHMWLNHPSDRGKWVRRQALCKSLLYTSPCLLFCPGVKSEISILANNT